MAKKEIRKRKAHIEYELEKLKNHLNYLPLQDQELLVEFFNELTVKWTEKGFENKG